ncbi:MliC family protein [Cupriavidus taiwanensis]|uniref:Membrane-bound lysozyme inhibitor of C-type lysozyme n=1 Tax=Cupriavidus taiwanensis TaxID=164546 RepID=A0A375GYK7_9BURK|nr:MliC family protein [Cupriavidus taiwanensis]SOY43428.1 putative lipoprotein [Cupriavidus taiwanensis]SOY45909.1 putative lipoprotein [Cupriavidus taiwanensis]SOY81367.1 putative lipoprotein [Cupriavidus taiwanensis]SOZ22634.1 putative lipoprotein [Cupriavidus taiwanensis]SOZ54412.1 putative lipoprotein [Cupriavidus taiwanensis]
MSSHLILSRTRTVALLAFVCASAAAHAARAPGIDGVRFAEVRTLRYQCDGGKTLTVRYFNSPDNQAAVLRIEGKPVLAVSTVAASGARYVGGRYEWWTKGESGTLRDLMQAEGAAPMLANCHAAP